jgi:hypothetical protein
VEREMPQQKLVPDDDPTPVTVPRTTKTLVPVSADRIRKLHRHLVNALLASQAVEEEPASPVSPKPELDGFPARVASVACSLCQGWCCTSGDDDGFLGAGTMIRVRRANPELELVEIANLYLSRVPDRSDRGSCIFHGRNGCTLERSLRSDVCNDYYCEGLGRFLNGGDYGSPVVVVAAEGEDVRTSPVIVP